MAVLRDRPPAYGSTAIGSREISVVSQHRNILYLALAAFFVISPNILIFSTDDLFVFTKSSLTGRFASGQAADGQYTFALPCYLMQFIDFSNTSYLIISVSTLSLSLSSFYMSITRVLQIVDNDQIWCGFLLFITFGLSLDLYQFVFADLAYAVSFLCVAAVILIIADVDRHPVQKVSFASFAMFIALGSYQIASITLAMVLLSISAVSVIRGQPLSNSLKFSIRAILSVIIGSLLYLAFNGAMHMEGVSSFTHYPRREQGLHYVAGNIPRYIESLNQLAKWSGGQYEPLLPSAWHLVFMFIIIQVLSISFSQNFGSGFCQASIVVIAIAILPNPLNLLLGVYWPSARSFSSFGIFVGLVSASLIPKRKKGPDLYYKSTKRYVVYALVVVQVITAVQRYRDRLNQQESDIGLAQAILANVYTLFPTGEPIHIEVGVKGPSIGVLAPRVLDFGRSYFATSWSAPALFEYLSDNRVTASNASNEDCKPEYPKLYIRKDNNRALVCITM